ncbi:MAG: hypothetical protein FWC43_02630 [Planctomycetaceae bacterium]|nr:hypothetical protein [Planctomycetaceae bacterium]
MRNKKVPLCFLPSVVGRLLSAVCRLTVVCCLLSAVFGGCASYRPPVSNLPWLTNSPNENSQELIPTHNHEALWEAIAEAVSLTFTIASEEPIRAFDNILTEGRLETEPKIGASVLEPWHDDSVTLGDRIESTYQTIRRRAVVRVIPEESGFLVQVIVYCEMEDLPKPIKSNASATLFQKTTPSERVTQQGPVLPESNGWFLIGRDPALEKQILQQILFRFRNPPNLIRAAEPELF